MSSFPQLFISLAYGIFDEYLEMRGRESEMLQTIGLRGEKEK